MCVIKGNEYKYTLCRTGQDLLKSPVIMKVRWGGGIFPKHGIIRFKVRQRKKAGLCNNKWRFPSPPPFFVLFSLLNSIERKKDQFVGTDVILLLIELFLNLLPFLFFCGDGFQNFGFYLFPFDGSLCIVTSTHHQASWFTSSIWDVKGVLLTTTTSFSHLLLGETTPPPPHHNY